MHRSRISAARLTTVVGSVCAVLTACTGAISAAGHAAPPTAIPAAAVDETVTAPGTEETTVLAGGCFWGVQGVFEHVRGVRRAVAGYAGGDAQSAHYDDVSGGDTGHAESVQITYDPSQITYGRLLQIYFSVAHDPTEVDRQGPDVGTQYRSAIFPQNVQQKQIATAYIAQLDQAGVFGAPIATRVESVNSFFPAEGYHQDYMNAHPDDGYIATNDLPKLDDLKRRYPASYREQPILTRADGDAGDG